MLFKPVYWNSKIMFRELKVLNLKINLSTKLCEDETIFLFWIPKNFKFRENSHTSSRKNVEKLTFKQNLEINAKIRNKI